MVRCVVCFGTGKIRCVTCHGRGYISRLTNSGEMDTSPCAVCAGSGKMRCYTCGGSRQINPVGQPSIPSPSKPAPGSDALEGQWNGQEGTWMRFTRDGNKYQITEGSMIGTVGTGIATLHGDIVKLEVTNNFLGFYRMELKLVGNKLEGMLSIGGIPQKLTLHRG